ncbi:FAD-dependent oxidoreductase [Mesorhizobium sp. M8A.F.Ca.ET.173.01.1.1]|nr:FAD-dependent oxidoreductase [Mesorhizobium sp. M8A.F.Ca.ET.173.01.1.1]
MDQSFEVDADVIIIGGGFAGAVALRELSSRGVNCILLEARDCLGGRTKTIEWHGRVTEVGGQWLHWLQPHVWSEVTRYGLELYERKPIQRVRYASGGAIRECSVDEFHDLYSGAWQTLYAGATDVFPRPHDPLYARAKLAGIDKLSIRDKLTADGVEGEVLDAVRALASVSFNAPPDDGALSQGMRRLAMVGGDPDLLAQTLQQFRLRDGTRRLHSAILSEGEGSIELNAVVSQIRQNPQAVEILLADGRTFTSRAAVVTVPLSTLGDIEFSPPLAKGKSAFVSEGQMTQGSMFWLRLRNMPQEALLALAPPEHPLSYLRVDDEEKDGTVIANGFSPSRKALDPSDRSAIEKAVRLWVPKAQLVEHVCHDWATDPFSKQTWTMLKPGQLSSYFDDLQRPEGSVFFAGADYASGWFGFIDGAIQSAHVASRQVAAYLQEKGLEHSGSLNKVDKQQRVA